MASRKPLVLVGGAFKELPAGDTLAGAVASVAGLTGAVTASALSSAMGLGNVQSDLVQTELALVALRGDQLQTAYTVIDDFVDQDGVDAAGSTGEAWASGKYAQASQALTLPTFTGPTASGWTVSASADLGGSYEPYRAVDGSAATRWGTTSAPTWWLKLALPVPGKITSYTLQGVPDNGGTSLAMKDFKLQGSTDEIAWTDLDARTGQTWTTAINPAERKTYTVSSPGYYSFYRVLITKNGNDNATNYCEIAELLIVAEQAPSGLDLRSIAYAAQTAPSKASLTVLAKATAALTPNTNLTGKVSRDGGTTWVTGTLVARNTIAGFTVYEACDIDLTGVASGTSMKWRVESAADGIEVTAAVLQWSPS